MHIIVYHVGKLIRMSSNNNLYTTEFGFKFTEFVFVNLDLLFQFD